MEIVGNAQLIAGDEHTIESVLALLKKIGVDSEGNPDVYVRSYRHFGVDEAREIRERAALKASDERRVFVIATPVITTEAQNALLKMLEDAPGDALFCIIVPNPHTLLGTIRSRSHILDLPHMAGEKSTSTVDARAFLATSAKERLEMLHPLLEKGDDEGRDMGAIAMFLSSLEAVLSKRRITGESASALEAVYLARKYLGDKGALVKPLLEQVALLVPRMKT